MPVRLLARVGLAQLVAAVCCALASVPGCARSHLREGSVAAFPRPRALDAGPGIDAPELASCEAPTSIEAMDRFVHAMVEASRPLRSTRAVYDDWAYVRERVAARLLVLDARRAEECVLWTATARVSPWNSASPCATALRPRCPSPVGTPCGHNADCDPGSTCHGWEVDALGPRWFATPRDGGDCQRRGRCEVATALGGECFDRNRFAECAPSAGADAVDCRHDGTSVFRCTRIEHRTVTTDCRDTERLGDGTLRLDVCPAGEECWLSECRRIENDLPLFGSCRWTSECADGRICVGERCRDPGSIRCMTATDCGLSTPAACREWNCVFTDGSRGAACDVDDGSSDCLPGLACRDGVCGDLIPAGDFCRYMDHGGCGTGCCVGIYCVPIPP